MSLLHFYIRIRNAFLYKVGMRIPYSKVRARSMRALGHSVGKDVYFPSDLVITQNFVSHRGKLTLGDRVSIGPRCVFVLASHPNSSKIRYLIDSKNSEITVGRDAWIGAGVIILPGITIGEGAVIGAGAVVTKDVPPYTVSVGNPAKAIRTIQQ